AFQGSLSSLPAPRLGAVAIKAALERAGVKPEEVKTVFMGHVLQGGVGQAPARQASLYAGIPKTVPCVTVNKVCGSGLEADIEAVEIFDKKGGKTVVDEDEGPKLAKPDKIASLKPAFKKDGTVTAANASSINDGAAAVVLMSAERAKRENPTVLARLGDFGHAARDPVEFTIAPADAINQALGRARLKATD